MKYLFQLTVLFLGTMIISCKKDEVKLTPLTSINIINAIVSGTAAKMGSNATTIANNNFAQLGLVAGSNSIYIYPTTDSLHPYYNKTINTNNGDVYSLFLAGNVATQIDTILVKENIPYRTDSTAGIRFINLSPNSTPLNITLSTTPTVNEVTGLAYKSYTDFKTYPGMFNSAYTFQIRDAVTNNVLTTFAFTATTVPRFANVTLVIRGLVGTTPAIGVTRVNNDR